MIIRLDDKKEYDNIGEKAKSIMRMKRKGFCVPDGIVLDEEIFEDIFLQSPRKEEFEKCLSELNINNIEIISKKMQGIIEEYEMPDLMWREIEGFLDKNKKYAVRSSSSKEDLGDFSFAGQYETYLNMYGFKNIKIAVKKCYKSMFSTGVLHYFIENNIKTDDFKICIMIQEMVEAEKSGVVFTINPMNGNDTELIIEVTEGIGENLVSGKVVPKRCIYDWQEEKSIVPMENNALSKEQLHNLIKTSLLVQKEYEFPCDIEFAFDKDKLYLLQARPITNIMYSNIDGIWTDANFKDGGVSSKVCKPFMWSLYEYIWDDSLEKFFTQVKLWNKSDIVKLGKMFYGRPYWNLGAVKQVMEKVPGYKEREFDEDLGVTVGYEGSGKVTKINICTLLPFIKTVISFKSLVSKRVSDFENIKKNLIDKYNDYSNSLINVNELDEIEKDWIRLVKDDYHQSESVYFSQVFINTIWQTLFKDKMIKYVDKEEYINLISGLENISHLRLREALKTLSLKIRDKSEIYNYWNETFIEQINSDYKTHKKGLYFEEVDEYMKEYGYHSDRELDVSYPSYFEDITSVIKIIKQLINSEEESVSHSYRDSLTSLKSRCGKIKYRHLKKDIEYMRNLLWWREEFKDISTRYYFLIRMYTLKLADKYVNKGILNSSEDIWFLKIKDIFDFMKNKIEARDLRDIVEKNRKYYISFRKFSNPDELGMKNKSVIKDRSCDSKRIQGVGSSSGEVRAVARVVMSIKDIDKIKKGEILVTKFTDTGWTSRFSSLGGLITEHGGILCHASIVSREYKMPCIVSAKNVTKLIKDGSTIHMNGETGEIEWISD